MKDKLTCTCTTFVVAFVALCMTSAAWAQSCGDPDAGDCCSNNGTPACDDAECCETVCAADSFCCDTSWDGLCADQAAELCGDLCGGGGGGDCPGDGDCCEANGTPGCDNEACCSCICACDPFCCDTEWDAFCAGEGFVGDCGASNPNSPCTEECADCVDGGGGDDDPCPWDLNDDGEVGVSDLLALLEQWGGAGDADFDGDDIVGVSDLLALLGNWGDCPTGDCVIDADGTDEGEACGEDTNGGCNAAGSCAGASGDCCEANGTPGCEDPECQEAICAADSFCCETSWDGICADAACNSPACDCQEGGSTFGSIECGETVVGTGWADGGTRDTDWFQFTVDEETEVVATLQSQFDGVVFIVDASDCGAPAVLGTTGASADCEVIQPASACVSPGTYVVFVAPGNPDGSGVFEGFPCGFNNDYAVTLECNSPCPPQACCFSDGSCMMLSAAECANQGGEPQGAGTTCDTVDCPAVCGEGAGDCCSANGTIGCEDPECCEQICAADPFCCETSWDGICADAANDQCDVCNIPASNCCAANDTPGCDDPKCEAAVCEIDPFCCDVEWDGACADEAQTACPDICDPPNPACGPDAGDCCAANGSPGCDNADCCACICDCDPFCCDTEWDAFCAGEGFVGNCGASNPDSPCTEQCADCVDGGGGGGSDCCEANGTPGCDDQACEDLICGQDAFCCETSWDGICADAANKQCEVCQ